MRTNFPRALSNGLALSLAVAALALVFASALASTRANAQSREPQQPGAGAQEEKPKPPANPVVHGRAVFTGPGRPAHRPRVRLGLRERDPDRAGRAALARWNGRFC